MTQSDYEDGMDARETEALSGFSSAMTDGFDDDLPSRGLLSFYDRLRGQILTFVEKKGGRMAPHLADMFLLIPDVFVLLLRLVLDKDVPKESRALIGSALAYFVVPIDLLPEAFVGPAGYADDLMLGLAVMAQAFGQDLEPYADKYWSGSRSLRRTVGDVLAAGHGLLGTDLNKRLRALLASKGVDLDAIEADRSAEADG